MNFFDLCAFSFGITAFMKLSENHIIDFYQKFLPIFLPELLVFEIFYFVLSFVTVYYIITRLRPVTYP